MMGSSAICCVAALLVGGLAGFAESALADVKAVSLGTFERPTHVAVAPGAGNLLFVVEQAGRIRVLRNEQKQAEPFLDIADLVYAPPDPGAGGEQGLLSVAFAPNYERSRRFYVAFVNGDEALEINEFQRSHFNGLKAIRATRRVLLIVPHPNAGNHNGGQLQFGPDGLLYISTGDGGGAGDPDDNARDLESLLGKILRIDPSHRSGRLPYAIPRTNPFVGKAGLDQIFAYGLRNPWRFTFDFWRIAIGDVGQGRQEEVNLLALPDARGVNFGWPEYEGDLVFSATRPGPTPPKFPILTYDHTNGRCAIIGGYVVRNHFLNDLNGRYLYGDACTGEVRSFIPNVSAQTVSDDKPTGIVLPGLSSFGRGFAGRIYFAQTSGAVSRLVPVP